MKATLILLFLMLSMSLAQALSLTSCQITPVNDSQGAFSYYNVIAYGLNPSPKSIDLTTAGDIQKVNDVINDASFSWSGTMYRTWMIWNEGSLNRIDFQTSVTLTGNTYYTWSGGATTKVATLKTLIESK